MTRLPSLFRTRSSLAALCVALLLGGCGGSSGGDSPGGSGGGGGGGTGGSNSPPVAEAGPGRNVLSADFVNLAGEASDPDSGDTLSFRWAQVSGPAVALTDSTTLTPGFVAPSGTGGGGGGASVTVSGKLQYEFVPVNSNCNGLNYNAIGERPIRRATVQALDQSAATQLTFELTVTDGSGATATDTVDVLVGGLLASGVSDDNGDYALAVPEDTDISVRVRAELQQVDTPSWNVEVRDNTLNTAFDLSQRPLYVLDGTVFNTGNAGATRNLTATTGWDGTAYTQPRAAAPFAVLDSVYTAMQLVLSVDPATAFPPLDVFWSVNNTSAEGSGSNTDNIDSGEIGTSFYSSGINSLFLLGKANDDTEEFDDHVIVHEWGHYFEDVFSRSDSVGGAHGFGDRLDMRVAFGEGWATALSGIALGDLYCDTRGSGQSGGFGIDIEGETEGGFIGTRGWFNEFSAMALIYDLWDDTVVPETGAGDGGSIGFAPIYDTMTGPQRTTAAHTSIFSFTEELRAAAPASEPLIDSLRAHQGVNGTGIYGAGESNDSRENSDPPDVLPVYTTITPDGMLVPVCSNSQFDNTGSDGNKLSEYQFLRMTITNPGRYRFSVITDLDEVVLPADDPDDDRDQSDPDIVVYRDGTIVALGVSGDANEEVFTTPNSLPAGDYVMDIVEFRYRDDETAASFPEKICFDVTIEPAP